jgi:hypothetical protein
MPLSFSILLPAASSACLIVLTLLQVPQLLRTRDEWKYSIGIIAVLALFVFQAGGDRIGLGAGIGITILIWYSFSELLSAPLARPLRHSQKRGILLLSGTLAIAALFFYSHGDIVPAILGSLGSMLLWIYFLPHQASDKIGKKLFGIREEIIEEDQLE